MLLQYFLRKNEKTRDAYTRVTSSLVVSLEIFKFFERGVDSQELIEACLVDIERRIREDYTCDGIAVDCNVVATATSLDGRFDSFLEGAMNLEVKYMHLQNDPRRLPNGDFADKVKR